MLRFAVAVQKDGSKWFEIWKNGSQIRNYLSSVQTVGPFQEVWDWVNGVKPFLGTLESLFVAHGVKVFGVKKTLPPLKGLTEEQYRNLIVNLTGPFEFEEMVSALKEVATYIPFEKRLLFALTLTEAPADTLSWLPAAFGISGPLQVKFYQEMRSLKGVFV